MKKYFYSGKHTDTSTFCGIADQGFFESKVDVFKKILELNQKEDLDSTIIQFNRI